MENKTGKQKKQIGISGIAGIMLASSLTVMVGNAITPALPALGEVYGLGNYASWLVTAPALGVVATAILFGKLIDKKGPYLAAAAGLLCYGVLVWPAPLCPMRRRFLSTGFSWGRRRRRL